MNFIFLYKFFILISIIFIASCKSVERIVDLNFKKNINIPEINNQENVENILLTNLNFKSNFTKKFYLEKITKSKNVNSKLKTIIIDENFIRLTLILRSL
jgi:hypothetical protein